MATSATEVKGQIQENEAEEKNEAESTQTTHEDIKSEENADTKESKHRSWFTVDVFLFFLACFQVVNLLTLTYTDSVLNFIAKRFQIPNTMASFIPSSYQVGSMFAVMPVAYFGAKWHRPRAICFGVIVMLLGLGFCILPHFILHSLGENTKSPKFSTCKRTRPSVSELKDYLYELEHSGNSTISTLNFTWPESTSIDVSLKKGGTNHKAVNWFNSVLHSLAQNYHSKDKLIKPSLTTPVELPCNANGTVYNPSILLVIGHALVGMGASPLWPLGISYLDDHLVGRKMPLYLGIFIGTTLTGPVAGFLLGSLSSAIYVSIDAHNMKPTDPAWIGAWWLGYVIAGILLVILLIPFAFFPASLEISEEKRKEIEEKEAELAQNETEHEESAPFIQVSDYVPEETIPLLCQEETNRQKILSTIKDLAAAICRLISIPVVLCSFASYIILANLLSGVTTFGSTFIQREFNVLRITSDMLIGGICVPLSIAGTFGGGYIMNKFNFSIRQVLCFNFIMSSIGTVCLCVLFIMGCKDPGIAGVSLPYKTSSVINVTSNCNSNCACTKGELELVCSSDNITYISPCYAGCSTHIPNPKGSSAKETFSDCTCVNTPFRTVKLGSCSTPQCVGLLATSMVAVGIGILILCLCQAPTYAILLRVLVTDDKPLAIGLLTFLSRILGFVPAPIWFGVVIDKSCVYWGPVCKGKAVCKLYHNKQLRLNYVGACVGCACGYVLTYAITSLWFTWCQRTLPKKDDVESNEKIVEEVRRRVGSGTSNVSSGT